MNEIVLMILDKVDAVRGEKVLFHAVRVVNLLLFYVLDKFGKKKSFKLSYKIVRKIFKVDFALGERGFLYSVKNNYDCMKTICFK